MCTGVTGVCMCVIPISFVDAGSSVCPPGAIFFFFKQKTAYEMRISVGSSDVCSSDLRPGKDIPFWATTADLPKGALKRGEIAISDLLVNISTTGRDRKSVV